MGATYVGLSEIQREWNALEDAQQTATQALRIMEHWPSPTDRLNAYLALTRVAMAQGNLASAEEALSHAVEIGRSTKLFPATQANLEACQVRLWLAKNELAAVRQWAECRAGEIEALLGEKPDFVAEREGLTLARGLMGLGPDGVDQAIRLLIVLADTSRVAGQTGMLIEALALLAHGYHSQGNIAAAVKTIRECLVLAEEENFLRLFLDEGEIMRAVLADFQMEAAKGGAPALLPYVTKILSAFPPAPGKTFTPNMAELGVHSRKDARIEPEAQSAKSELIEPLSPRELEVLDLICQGASNQEIAAKLVVTLNTIKKHNNRIFGKLGVTSRVQAVLQARRLGLVPESNSPPDE
jgi:LuxR family maltose regulon positive regulatory protein